MIWAVVCLVVVAAVAAVLVLALSPASGGGGSPRAVYLQRAGRICAREGARLDRIPPPVDIASPGNVLATVDKALPIVREQAALIRALTPPADLRSLVARFFVLTDRSIGELEAVRRAAEHTDVASIGIGLRTYGAIENQAKALARRIGYRC